MTAKSIYLGQLRVESIHLKSQEVIITDAPTDNNGKGEAFSPTDTVASALASCMLTIMGIVAARKDWDIKGAAAQITKVMASSPRRIAEVQIVLTMPQSVNHLDDEERSLLEVAARNCPVAKSLHPDLKQVICFDWL